MATEQVDNASQGIDFLMLCRAVADGSPMPMAGLGGSLHTLRYVNLAFCLLTGKSKDELIGTAFCDITAGTNECMLLLDRVAKTGLADSHTGQEHSAIHPLYWSYAMWPLLGADHGHLGIMIQVTEAAKFHDDAVAMNQALLVGSVRQHELTEASVPTNFLVCHFAEFRHRPAASKDGVYPSHRGEAADLLNVQLQAAIGLAIEAQRLAGYVGYTFQLIVCHLQILTDRR